MTPLKADPPDGDPAAHDEEPSVIHERRRRRRRRCRARSTRMLKANLGATGPRIGVHRDIEAFDTELLERDPAPYSQSRSRRSRRVTLSIDPSNAATTTRGIPVVGRRRSQRGARTSTADRPLLPRSNVRERRCQHHARASDGREPPRVRCSPDSLALGSRGWRLLSWHDRGRVAERFNTPPGSGATRSRAAALVGDSTAVSRGPRRKHLGTSSAHRLGWAVLAIAPSIEFGDESSPDPIPAPVHLDESCGSRRVGSQRAELVR